MHMRYSPAMSDARISHYAASQPRLPASLVALNLVTLGVTLVMNVLANALPLNGRTTGQISDAFSSNVFVPAGYVFSVWGLIYTGLIAFAVYQLTPVGRRSPTVRSVGGAVRCQRSGELRVDRALALRRLWRDDAGRRIAQVCSALRFRAASPRPS
jgi:hypothetical protein